MWLFRVEGGGVARGLRIFFFGGWGGVMREMVVVGKGDRKIRCLDRRKGELALGTGGLFLDKSLGHVRVRRKCLGGNFRLDDCGYPLEPWTRFLDEVYFRVEQRHRNRSAFGIPKILEPL